MSMMFLSFTFIAMKATSHRRMGVNPVEGRAV